jgi:hypothetical protein
LLENVTRVVVLGVGATAVADLWALALKGALKTSVPDYSLVGRWIGHMAQGRFAHRRIALATPVPFEQALGWVTHYVIGVGFAGAMIAITGVDWLVRPTPLPALIFGLATVAAPFLIMQPAFGLGVASAKSPNPWAARLRSLANHLWFGVGLYLSGVAVAALLRMTEGAA